MDSALDPQASRQVAMSSLCWCAASRQVALLKGVLTAHFSSSSISDLGKECCLVLRHAVSSGCKETLTSLLLHVDDAFLHQRHGGDVMDDVRGGRTRSETLLGLAVEQGHRDVAEVLLLKETNPNTSYRNKPLLHLSLSLGHAEIATLLAHHGADVNLIDRKGETPLFAALSSEAKGMDNIIDDLIKRGADVKHGSLTGRQPIHCAALSSGPASARSVTRLADSGCDVSARDGVLGDTPLHLACSRCNQEAVVALVRHGAQFNAVNNQGHTPLRKLLQHATRLSRDSHHTARVNLARRLLAIGFRLTPSRELTPPLPATNTSCLDTAGETKVLRKKSTPEARHSSGERNSLGERNLQDRDPSACSDTGKPSAITLTQKKRKADAFSRAVTAEDRKEGRGQVTGRAVTAEDRKEGRGQVTGRAVTAGDRKEGRGQVTARAVTAEDRKEGRGQVTARAVTAEDRKEGRGQVTARAVTAEDREEGRGQVTARAVTAGDREEGRGQVTARPGCRAPGSSSRDKVGQLAAALAQERAGRVGGLQHLCRLQLRKSLPPVLFQARVRQLELSPQLRQYLMFLPCLLDESVG